MSGDWSQPYPAGYWEQLAEEAKQTSLPRERKAAIVAELESRGKRTADEDRSGVETAGVAPGGSPATAGRHAGDAGALNADDEGGR